MLDLGGTYRAISPEETLSKIEPMLWDVFGITRVANVTGLDNICIPTYVAIRPLSKMLTTSQGKGITDNLAKVSAIMESIEGWHAENLPEPDLFGSYAGLKNDYPLVSLESLFNGSFKFQHQKVNTLEMPWLKGTELNTGKPLYFPMSLVNLDFASYNRDIGYFTASSNGLASGNTLDEAICHGIYEVIERHCWALAEKQPKRQIDLSTITSPHIKSLLAHLEQKMVRLEAFDMTSDFNIPVYRANIFDLTGVHAVGVFGGAGAHLSSVVALSRAITEAVQSRLTFISGARDDVYPLVYKSVQSGARDYDLLKTKKIALKAPVLHPFKETTPPTDFKQCIQQVLTTLKQSNVNQVIAYDHTRDSIGIPVVHVLIPGLEFDLTKHLNYAYFPEEI